MNNITLQDWSNIAQVLTMIVTFIGIIISIRSSTNALREVQLDRRLRSKPHLAFESGGWPLAIEFRKIGCKVPGYDPIGLKEIFGHLPEDAESVLLSINKDIDGNIKKAGYGRLRNYGGGAALSTHITWIAKEIWIADEKFEIGEKKREEIIYQNKLNTWPSLTSNIQAGEESSITCIPTFIVKDIKKKITRVNGVLEIKCKDIFDLEHIVFQEFYFFTDYKAEKPSVHVTFSNVLSFK